MRSVTWVTLWAGLLIGGSYLVGSAVRTWVARQRLAERPGVVNAIAESTATLACAYVAYEFIDWLAPGGVEFRASSAVGFLSSKTLTVWESVALWAGLAAIIGAIVPVTSRFRDGSMGLAGAAAMLLVYSPIALLIALGAWFVGISVIREVRPTLPIVFVTVASAEWVLSMTRDRLAWGVIHGPETTIWMAVLAGVLVARWSHGGPDVVLPIGRAPRQ